MPTDEELCCAAGYCCNKQKRRAELAELLTAAVPTLTEAQSAQVADAVHDAFDIVPKSLNLGDFLERFAAMAREHPYE